LQWRANASNPKADESTSVLLASTIRDASAPNASLNTLRNLTHWPLFTRPSVKVANYMVLNSVRFHIENGLGNRMPMEWMMDFQAKHGSTVAEVIS
jgi:hypothetical protein